MQVTINDASETTIVGARPAVPLPYEPVNADPPPAEEPAPPKPKGGK